MAEAMTVEQAALLYDALELGGVRCWVMGGWGVDALLGYETRPHKDLDLLVHCNDLAKYMGISRSAGFSRKFEWSENQPFHLDGVNFDTAFVDAHPDGRQIDVHVVDLDRSGAVVQLAGDPWPLPTDALSGKGTLCGREVRCVSRAAQLAMHSCYDLPEKHREDERLLQGMEG